MILVDERFNNFLDRLSDEGRSQFMNGANELIKIKMTESIPSFGQSDKYIGQLII